VVIYGSVDCICNENLVICGQFGQYLVTNCVICGVEADRGNQSDSKLTELYVNAEPVNVSNYFIKNTKALNEELITANSYKLQNKNKSHQCDKSRQKFETINKARAHPVMQIKSNKNNLLATCLRLVVKSSKFKSKSKSRSQK